MRMIEPIEGLRIYFEPNSKGAYQIHDDGSVTSKEQRMNQPKMTREEALDKLPHERWYGEDGKNGYLLDSLEKLGLLEFDERKKHEVMGIISFNSKQYIAYTKKDFGYVKIEAWPEGLVLWVGGVIVWKSWATVNNYVVDLARKEYCNGPIAYDCDNPLNTIREMHKVIEKLVNQIDALTK